MNSTHSSRKSSHVLVLIVTILGVIVLAGAVTGYYFLVKPRTGQGHMPPEGRQGQWDGQMMGNRSRMMPQLNQSEIDAITSYFQTHTDSQEVGEYCAAHRQECFYYCRRVDPGNSLCTSLMLPQGNFTQRGGRP